MNRNYVYVLIISCGLFFAACGDDKKDSTTTETATSPAGSESTVSSDPKGVGPHQNIKLTHPLDEAMVTQGKNLAEVKCTSCHKLTRERLVGPGWEGVTDRRTPEWIMNFITNTDEMVQRDTAARNMLEVCLVKMPNQGLVEAEARSVLEFMRKNDGKN
ncbi:MAG: c-type cytochrome [Ferruginibacter sp.]